MILRHLLGHSHETIDKRQHKTIDVRACQIFEMAARSHAGLERRVDHLAITIYTFLAALELELVKDVIVATAGQHAGFFQAGFLYQAKVLLDCANPTRAFRVFVAEFTAFVERLAVVLCVQKELGLTNDTIGPAKTRQHIVDFDHLVDRVGRSRLLAIAKRRVGYDNVTVLD